jgi:hypothetical protein
MYAPHFLWCSAIDVCFRQSGNGPSLPITPSSHGASTTSTIRHDSTLKSLIIRRSMAFLPIPPISVLLMLPCRVVLGRHCQLALVHLPTIGVAQQHLLVRVGPRSDGERWVPKTGVSILSSRRRFVEKRRPFEEAHHVTPHRI